MKKWDCRKECGSPIFSGCYPKIHVIAERPVADVALPKDFLRSQSVFLLVCTEIEIVIANQSADWCGNPPVLPRTSIELVGDDAHIVPKRKPMRIFLLSINISVLFPPGAMFLSRQEH